MTREELNKKKVLLSLNNKKYEKVAHSGTENFLAYRKKVLEGRAKMDALKRQSEMFNVTEVNDKHYNELVNTGMLIHAQSSMYGERRDNAKYYKREGDPGHYRYYYTKEEYDAAHRTGASSDAEREAKARQQYETNKKIENYKNQNKQETGEAKELGKYEYNQAMNAEIKKFSDIAREGGAAAASKKMVDEGYADDLLYVIKKGLQSGKLTYKDGRFETDDAQLRADIDEESSFLQKRSREVGELSGKGKDIQKELEKLIISEIENLNNENEERKEISKKNDAGREAAIKAGQEAEQKRQLDEVRKENKKLYDEANELAAEKLSVNNKSAIDDIKMAISKSSGLKNHEVDKLVKEKASEYYSDEDKKKDEADRMALIEKRLALYDEIDKTGDGTNDYRNIDKIREAQEMGKKIRDMERNEYEKELKATIDALEDLMNDPKYGKTASKWLEFDVLLYDITRDLNEYGKKTNVSKQIQEFVDKYYKGAKHSDSDTNTITTSEPLTPEQEYLNFKAKVEAGMKKQETIRHSMFIKSGKKVDKLKDIKPLYDTNKFDFYENVKKFKEEHQNSLSHYGTKGQKWGTRHWQNDDGTFNEAGKERYFGKSSETKGSSGEVKENSKVKSKEEVEKEFQNSVRTFGADKNPFTDKDTIKKAKKLEKSFYNGKLINRDKIKEWINSEENKAMVDKYNELFDGIYGEKSKKINDLFKDYDADEDKYVAKAGICDAVMHGDKLGDIGWEISWMLNDDGDQGSRDSRSYYLQEKGYSKKDINNLYNDQEEAYEAAGAIANLTTKYNPVIYNMSDNIKTTINNELAYNYNKTHGYVHAKISGAADGMELDKNDISAANDIANKLSPSCGGVKSNGWYYVNQAINNLPDLKDKSYKELTQADWDKINAKINSLKK